MKTIRASSVPRISLCSASKTLPEIEFDSGSEPASIGSCSHDIIAEMLLAGFDTAPSDITQYLAKWDLKSDENAEEVRLMVNVAMKMWRETFSPMMEVLDIEQALETKIDDWTITGHTDVTAEVVGKPIIAVADWKTGRVRSSHEDQIKTYLLLAMDNYDCTMIQGFKSIIVWLRDGVYEIHDYTVEDLEEHAAHLRRILSDDTYNPGQHCVFCPRNKECKARQVWLQSATSALMPMGDGAQVTEQKIAELWPMAKELERSLKEFKEATKLMVDATGPISLGDGNCLDFQVQNRDSIRLTAESNAIIKEALCVPDLLSELEGGINVKKKTLLDAVSAKADRGQKNKAKEELMAALLDSGSVSTTTIRKLVARKEK